MTAVLAGSDAADRPARWPPRYLFRSSRIATVICESAFALMKSSMFPVSAFLRAARTGFQKVNEGNDVRWS